jgi:hypothetical protein
MKIGLYNILVGFLYVFMMISTVWMGVISFTYPFRLVMLIPIGFLIFGFFLWFYFFKKFQIIIIYNHSIISIQPFLLKLIVMKRDEIKSKKWSWWMTSTTIMFLTLEIKDEKNKILISDAQFGNFYSLVNEIVNCDNPKPRQMFLKQAEDNSSPNKFHLAFLIFFLFISFFKFSDEKNPNGFLFKVSFILINLLLLYASINRYLQYKRIKNKA